MTEIQERIAELQSGYIGWKEMQAEKDSKVAQRIQALEETCHQETRSDSAKFSRWQIYAILLSSVLAAIDAVAAAFVILMNR